MRKAQVLVSVLLLVLLLVACAPAAAPAPAPAPGPAAAPAPAPAAAAMPAPVKPASWEVEWETVLAAAKKEGRVTFATSLGAQPRDAIVQGLKNTYGIPVEAIGGRQAEIDTKILAERRAGLYLWDVYMGGPNSPFINLEPVGALDPLDAALIFPDVTDPELIKKIWYRGQLWWVDRDHLVLGTLMGPYPPLAINTKLVKPGEIKSYNDLLDPKWKGKMNINDPTGPGTTFPEFISGIFGPDWLRKLANQEPTIMRDTRIQGEWLAHGKVAIAIGIKDSTYAEFRSVGAPIQVVVPAEGTWLSGGASSVYMFNRPLHPNAAKVFINWLLAKEAQTTLAKLSGGQSLREDVPTDFLEPWQIRQPEVQYYEPYRKENVLKKAEMMGLFKEIFGPLLK